MIGTPMPLIALSLAVLSTGVAIAEHGAEQRPVRMMLQSVTLTNSPWHTGWWQAVVFAVTNGGTKPVHLSSCGASFFPTNISMPLGQFGSCDVPPFTNATLAFLWQPARSGMQQWFRYAVFEQPGVVWKTTTTARAIASGYLGKRRSPSGWLSGVWSTNGWVATYEITSPPFAALPEPTFPPGEVGPSAASPAGLDLIGDWRMTSDEPFWPQPVGAASGSQLVRAETNEPSAADGSGR